MPLSPTPFEQIRQVLDLIATPLALEIIDGAEQGIKPRDAVPHDADEDTVEAAIETLRRTGVITVETNDDGPPSQRRVDLTSRGRRLLGAFEALNDSP